MPRREALTMTPKPYRLPKVRIVGLVQPRTLASLQAWRTAYGTPIGESLDALFDHAMRGEGAFIFRLPVNGKPLPDNSAKQHETTTL
jgi:hypothetical protein